MTGRGYEPFVVYFADADDDGALDQWGLVDNQGSWFAWGAPSATMRFTPDPTLTSAFVAACPMSVSALDFNRDGHTDWFLSGTSRRNMLLRGGGPRALHDVSGRAGVRGAGDAFSWGSYAFDVDLDGWVDVIAAQQSPDPPAMDPRDIALWVNQRDGVFDDWGPEVVGARTTALGLACGDLSGDGRVGCLAQTDGGAMVLRSRVEPEGRWVGLRFAPTVSASAAGATVTLEGASPPVVQRVDAQVSVYGHHDPGLVLAAGDRERVDLTVTWPSGLVQRLSDVATNGYVTATEPEALTLSTRVAPADGASRVEVRVAGGGDAVTIAREGDGAWEGDAVTGDDGVTRRALVAPTRAGKARVTVTIGGAALRVRPVVRFQ
ncbi:MAG: CRTAC1 family protein [Polyangiales bacterium]